MHSHNSTSQNILHPLHLEDLRRSGLNAATIEMMVVRSVPPTEINRLAPGGLQGVESVLEFPYPTVAGFSRYKVFPPVGDMRYFQKKDTGTHLYILPPVVEVLSDFNQKLYFVEGEKKTAAGVQAGLAAIAIGGLWNWKAKDTWKGTEELQLIPFADRDVEIVPDSDVWGRDDLQQAVYAFAKYLEFRGAKVSVVLIPPLTKGKVGLDDFFLVYSIEDFHKLKRINLKHAVLSQFKDWYESWRQKQEAKPGDNGLQGKPLFLREIELHAEPVDGAVLLTDLCRAIRRYVVAENADIVAIALWCVHAHAIDAFGISPFLNLSSPEKGCGKSTTLTAISYLLPRPLLSASVSPASIFRAIELYKPSFLIDEADAFENLNEDLRGLLNASHLRASAQAIRVVGDNHEPRMFSTWCPKAISLIGRLPGTLEDRSVVVDMKRRKKDELCERFSAIDSHPELETLGQKAARWVKDNFDAIRQARPVAEGIDLRIYDNWMPLLAVADLAGDQWPTCARIAANWFAAKAADSPSIKVELLVDMAEVMEGQDRMFSEDIVKALTDMADRPWPTFSRGKPITQVQIGRMVRGFGIKSKNVRIKDKQAKGYEAAEIGTVLSRYSFAGEASQSSQKIKDNELNELAAIFGTLQPVPVQEPNPSQASQNGNGHDVDGFDWASGTQLSDDEVTRKWAEIKAEHAAKKGMSSE